MLGEPAPHSSESRLNPNVFLSSRALLIGRNHNEWMHSTKNIKGQMFTQHKSIVAETFNYAPSPAGSKDGPLIWTEWQQIELITLL